VSQGPSSFTTNIHSHRTNTISSLLDTYSYLAIVDVRACIFQVPHLSHYKTYCANQVFAKGLLDYKKHDRKVEDFLLRCQESGFSRKLDLWNFLDKPRSRLVKYPLLLKQVHKYTEESHNDKTQLLLVVSNGKTNADNDFIHGVG